jgi:hypothetical protein
MCFLWFGCGAIKLQLYITQGIIYRCSFAEGLDGAFAMYGTAGTIDYCCRCF